MKTILPLIFFVFILSGCKKKEVYPDHKIIDGHYEGTYSYQDKSYGYITQLENNKYMEIIPGGVFYKKDWWCLSAGTYSINKGKLVFELDTMIYKYDNTVYQCDPDNFLPGEYTITYLNSNSDTLYFEKEQGGYKIEYRLWRFD